MSTNLVARLENWKSPYGAPDLRPLYRLLEEIGCARFRDAGSLIRLHECLLFLRAYPPSVEAMRQTEALLSSFAARVAPLRDLAPLEEAEVSGIAGTSFSAVFSYDVARQLVARYPRDIDIDWENYEQPERLGAVMRRCLPLAGEDWPVEAHVPFRLWVDAARPRRMTSLQWLVERIEALPLSARDRADLYESAEPLLLWKIAPRASRSRQRWPPRKPFFHRMPLLRRTDISLEKELAGAPLPVKQLTKPEARKALDLILDTSAVRYRELYGFTHPDAARVFRADAGRGVEIVFMGLPAEWRLPLRAYLGGMFFKNGVPAGYVEALSLFERAEVGFNLYYTFREGESAWLYARLLRLLRQILGVRCFAVDPYQIGHENDEALDSGAFWFYRKLGFRPLEAEAAHLVEREEARMRRTSGYRSSRTTLAKLARSYMLYECADAAHGQWDHFRTRSLALGCAWMNGGEPALRQFAEARGWAAGDEAMEAIIRAKSGRDETRYLHLMQRHARLRSAIIEAGRQA